MHQSSEFFKILATFHRLRYEELIGLISVWGNEVHTRCALCGGLDIPMHASLQKRYLLLDLCVKAVFIVVVVVDDNDIVDNNVTVL